MSHPHITGLGATFDWDLVERYGEILALGAQQRGEDVAAVAGMDGGPLFSSDPFLAGVMVKHLTMGIQKRGVDAHAQLDAGAPNERKLRENALIPFEMAIKDGDLARVSVSSAESSAEAEHVLRNEWGFDGFAPAPPPTPSPGYEEELDAMSARTVVLLDNAAGLLPLDPAAAGPIAVTGAVGGLRAEDLAEALRAELTEKGVEMEVSVASASNGTLIALGSTGDVAVVDCTDPAALGHPGETVLGCFSPTARDGRAIAKAILGSTNPSAKLPLDVPGYPFGFGRGYTTFELGTPRLTREVCRGDDMVVVRVDVTNTGSRTGAEVVQIYAAIPAAGATSSRLVGFRSIEVAAGATETVEIEIGLDWPNHPFSVWDEDARAWATPAGVHVLRVGTSLAHTPYVLEVEL